MPEIEAYKEYQNCRLCPRACGVDRTKGERGVCGCDSILRAARAALHYWEEPCLTGIRESSEVRSGSGERQTESDGTRPGSGAVFFTGCSLHCVYCQNYEISENPTTGRDTGNENGTAIDAARLTEIFFELKEKGAVNINLVTASHYIPHVAQAVEKAKLQGFDLPFVYNSSGYESVRSLKLLEGLIDIYLPDFKYMENETARKYSHAPDYPETAKTAIAEMVRQVPECVFANCGQEKIPIMKKGVIVRHLVLPGHVKEAKSIVSYLYETYGDCIYLSLMNQYTPLPAVKNDPLLGRKVTKREYESVLDHAIGLGAVNAFFQEGPTARESFIPVFDGEGIVYSPPEVLK